MDSQGSWLPQDFRSGLVSVIIPTYNRQEYLKEAVQSVIAQTYRPIECIIVDDGSTDNTEEVVKGLMGYNSDSFKLIYKYQQNSGAQVARNTGTIASSGDFIQYLDSDDLLFPQKIEKQILFLKENKECDGVWGGWAKGTIEKNEIIESHAREDLLTQFLTEHCVVNFSFLFRKSLVEKVGDWDVNIKRNQEIDFQVRGLLIGAKYDFYPQICGLWRIHDGDRIANNTGGAEILFFYKKWERVLQEKGLFSEQIKNNFANLFVWLAWDNERKKGKSRISEEFLCHAFHLNPSIAFANSSKMKVLRFLLPIELSIRLWWAYARKSSLKKNADGFST